MDNHDRNGEHRCEGVVECTALVLAESCAELDGRLTLFGILDEIRPSGEGEISFVVYVKFEGCEHASERERAARILLSDEEGEVLEESSEYSVWLDGADGSAVIVAVFELPEDLEYPDGDGGERMLWVEAVLDDETLSQTAVPLRERYNV